MAKVTVIDNGYSIESLYKWDTGQELEIYGMTLPVAPQVHFAHKGDQFAIVRQASMDASGVIRVSIPDIMLQSTARLCAYICTQQGEEFKTLCKIVIPVIPRAKPNDYAPEDEEYNYSLAGLELELIALESGAVPTMEKVLDGEGKLQVLRFGMPVGPQGGPGERGTGILKVTTAPSSYTTAIGDYIPKYRLALSTLKSQSKVDEVKIGDIIQYSYYQYQIDYLTETYAYVSASRVSLRGATGSDASVTAENIATALGYTPADAAKQVQGDFAENDPENPAHILNRTHWKETENGVFLFDQEVSGGNYTYAETIGLDIGEVYEVVFAGYILDMVGVEYSANGEMGVTLKRIDGESTIFEIVDYDPATAGKKGCAGRITTAGSSHSGQFVIFGNRVNWHRLDMRFMPHALGRVKTINDQLPDQYGNVQIEAGGVKSVNGKTPDKNGNVEIEVGGGGGSALADLAENDPNAAGYVKNRTHWRELELGEAIIDTSVSLAFQTNKTVTSSVADGLTQGSTYRVMWGGVEYQCVCGVSGANEPYLGNLALHDTSAEASDDPFCIVSLGGASYKVLRKVPGTYTLTVQALVKDVWHKLDSGYLPEPISLALGGYGIDLEVIVNAGGSAVVENTSLLWSKVADAWQAGNRLRVSIPAGDTELCVSDPMIWKVDDAGLCLAMNTALVMDTSLVALYIMLSPEVNDGEVNTAKTTVYAKSVLLG